MREIKFRAWDKVDKVMRYPLTMDVDGRNEKQATAFFGENTSDNNGYREFDKLIIEQYTGLNDKDGRKIYEGDYLYGLGYVEWCDKECRFLINTFGEMHEIHFDELEKEDLEIVGNIHDNPEWRGEVE